MQKPAELFQDSNAVRHASSAAGASPQQNPEPPPSIRAAFLGVGLLSALVNVLYLTGSLFMLEVYDRVLPSRSVPTLLGLAAIALLMYAFQGVFDVLRNRLLVRIGAAVDRAYGQPTYRAVAQMPLSAGREADGLQPLRDLDQVRAFLASPGPAALFDLPWIPLYLLLCFAFHVWIGAAVLAGAVLMISMTLLTDLLTRRVSPRAAGAAGQRMALAEAGRRNAEVLRAMGMTERTAEIWSNISDVHLRTQSRLADVTGGFGAVTKVLRFVLQSLVLGIGAYLVIQGEATGGIMIASSILVARALAPVELALANWKGLVAARHGWSRLKRLLDGLPATRVGIDLPAPRQNLRVEGVTVTAPGLTRALVSDVSFSLQAGGGLGIIGTTGSGKSSLIRGLTGVWRPVRGAVRLDSATLDRWAPEVLGRYIGYLPQDVELFAGTVAQNIARFDPKARSDDVIAAAQDAGIHDLICSLPNGYDSYIGEDGAVLSGGQRQRVALARALYGDPFLVVLDEPNSNLDAEGEEALNRAIAKVRARGGIVVIVAHRPSALAAVDHLLLLAEGRVRAFGRKDEVLPALKRANPATGPVASERRELAGPEKSTSLRVIAQTEGART